MIRRSIASMAGLGALVAAGLAVPSAAGAAPDPTSAPVERTTVSAAAQERTETYWTPERMRRAQDADVLVRDAARREASDSSDLAVAKGAPTVVGGRTAAPRPKRQADFEGGLYTGGGAVVRTTGKVFFTLAGSDYVCSGSSTQAANESLVQTAGHCLNEGPGDFATNFTFVPAYDRGSAPYGQFAATELLTTTQWADQGDLDYDVGYAVVGPSGGRTLADAVGAQGVGFNLARGAYTYAFGYPAAAPYDGEELAWCHGTVAQDTYGGSQDQGLVCDMTGGSSGGPWFSGYDETTGLGTLTSVNSFKYNLGPQSDRMFGPYLGSVVQAVYQQAQG